MNSLVGYQCFNVLLSSFSYCCFKMSSYLYFVEVLFKFLYSQQVVLKQWAFYKSVVYSCLKKKKKTSKGYINEVPPLNLKIWTVIITKD